MGKETTDKIKKPIYKKWWFWVIIALLVLGLFGCQGGSDEESANVTEPETTEEAVEEATEEPTEKTAAVDIDFEKLNSDIHEDLLIGSESEDYQFVQDYYVGISDDGKTINMTAVVDDATDPEKALDFADTLVRRTNLNAQLQDSSLESPQKDTYGGLYDRYNALIGIARASDQNNQKAWLVFDAITSSDGPALNLQNE